MSVAKQNLKSALFLAGKVAELQAEISALKRIPAPDRINITEYTPLETIAAEIRAKLNAPAIIELAAHLLGVDPVKLLSIPPDELRAWVHRHK